MHWSSFTYTTKPTKLAKQSHSKPGYSRFRSHTSRSLLAPFPTGVLLVLAVFGWCFGCGGGPTGLQKSNSFNALPTGPGAAPTAPSPSSSPSPANEPSVNLLSFGNAGFGGDDTNVIQNALNTTAANGQALRIPAGSYNINSIFFPNNSQLVLDAGVTITANPGYGPLTKMLNIKSQNVTIAGAGAASVIFKMRKSEYVAEHATDGSEWRHCLDIEGASNINISGISCNQSGGDGLYIAGGQNITISDSIFDQNFRQGLSLISGQHIFVYRCYFTNTEGTNPQSGIDIEPNDPSGAAADVHIEDSFTTGNAGAGVMLSFWKLDGTSQAVDVTVLRHHSSSNGQSGYDATNNDVSSNAQGKAVVQDCFSQNDGDYGVFAHWYQANGPALIFQNLSITNPHQKGPDPTYNDRAAVGLNRGSDQANMPMGNIQFLGVNISVSDGKVDRYFNFEDKSKKAFEKLVFSPGNLSGASQVPPNGLVQSVGYNTLP